MTWKIATINPDKTIAFAAEELQKYLKKMDNSNEYILTSFSNYNLEIENVIWVGLDEAFPLPNVEKAEFDDGISIKAHGRSGYISGTNPRSVLFGVYRFLKELGCAFVRPGDDGEIIPRKELSSLNVEIFDVADLRYRGMYIEASVSEDQLYEIINWLPKLGMNGYFFQYFNSYWHFSHWYLHHENYLYEPEEFNYEDSVELQNRLISELKKRGLSTYAVGHGWTNRAFNLAEMGEKQKTEDVPQEAIPYLAMTDGERKIFRNIPGNTQLCYSSPVVRYRLAKIVCDYAKDNPLIDYVMFNLADDEHNFCECENCRNKLPSDHYIDILNAIDEELTKCNLKTRIVFTAYRDLVWEPLYSKLKNPNRFAMKFSLYGRNYERVLNDNDIPSREELPAYELNKTKIPNDEKTLLGFLRNWQEFFPYETMLVDYHLMWDHYRDPGYYNIAKALHNDIKAMQTLKSKGFLSCQTQRVFLPTALPMVSMAETMWNLNADFENIANEYFLNTFGPCGKKAQNYLSSLSNLFDHKYLRNMTDIFDEEIAKKFDAGIKEINDFKAVIQCQINSAAENGLKTSQVKSWEYLVFHGELYTLLGKSFAFMARGCLKEAEEMRDKTLEYARQIEKKNPLLFDAYEFTYTYRDMCFAIHSRRAKQVMETNN